MRIAYTGLNLPEGKVKHQDPVIIALTAKFKPRKISPYFFEFLPGDYARADAIAMARDRVLDLLIHDIEKVETRIDRSGDPAEQALLRRCLEHLEAEQPLYDLQVEDAARRAVQALGFLSSKPMLLWDPDTKDPDRIGRELMAKAGMMFFYTAGNQEVRAWFVRKGVNAVTCASKIHSDLARGFVKAEIVSVEDLMTAHSMQDARGKGLTRLVDRDYVIEENTVLEIRFSV